MTLNAFQIGNKYGLTAKYCIKNIQLDHKVEDYMWYDVWFDIGFLENNDESDETFLEKYVLGFNERFKINDVPLNSLYNLGFNLGVEHAKTLFFYSGYNKYSSDFSNGYDDGHQLGTHFNKLTEYLG